MPSGGARNRSGPPPDPNALRRDRPSDAKEWRTLSAEGRSGPPPSWPLSRATSRELQLWEREWRRPQAVVWEENGQELEVAMCVRSLRDAEKPNAPVAARTLVRQQMDALGLTVPGLRSNRWRIGGSVADGPSVAAESEDIRDRLKVVMGGA